MTPRLDFKASWKLPVFCQQDLFHRFHTKSLWREFRGKSKGSKRDPGRILNWEAELKHWGVGSPFRMVRRTRCLKEKSDGTGPPEGTKPFSLSSFFFFFNLHPPFLLQSLSASSPKKILFCFYILHLGYVKLFFLPLYFYIYFIQINKFSLLNTVMAMSKGRGAV